jgi:hypothetical protein
MVNQEGAGLPDSAFASLALAFSASPRYLRCLVGNDTSPFSQKSCDDSLGFAVGLRRAGLGPDRFTVSA